MQESDILTIPNKTAVFNYTGTVTGCDIHKYQSSEIGEIMIRRAIAVVFLLLSWPLHAQDLVDTTLDFVTGELLALETQTPGGEVLSLMCDKGTDGLVTLVYRRHCPSGSVDDDIAFVYTAGQSDIVISNCDGTFDVIQSLVIFTDRELAEIGRGLNTLCRELPFDEAAVCN